MARPGHTYLVAYRYHIPGQGEHGDGTTVTLTRPVTTEAAVQELLARLRHRHRGADRVWITWFTPLTGCPHCHRQ